MEAQGNGIAGLRLRRRADETAIRADHQSEAALQHRFMRVALQQLTKLRHMPLGIDQAAAAGNGQAPAETGEALLALFDQRL